MENQHKQVIHLYEFEQQSINEKQISKQIVEALKGYFGQNIPQIKIKGRPHKYWAYFEVDPETATKLNELKTVKIGNHNVNVGRYYHDYQIFINKLDKSVSKEQVTQYFKQFGDVDDIVISQPAEKKVHDHKHCYIKMKDQKTIDRVVLARLHKIQGKQVKPVRTFGLHQDKESDKKLFLKIEGLLDNIEDFEQKSIQFFMKQGKIRERPKVENIYNQKYKMIVTFTNFKDAANAIQAFPSSELFAEYKKKNVNLFLSYFHSKQNKIYVSGLKDNSEKTIRQAFEKYGQITEITQGRTRDNSLTATIGFANQHDFKNVLASYIEDPKLKQYFIGKPYVTLFLTAQQKKQYQMMRRKNHNQPINQGPRQNNFGAGQFPISDNFPVNFNQNPQFRMGGPMGNQNIPPNLGPNMPSNIMPNMMGPNMMPPQPNMIPNMGMGGQFNQGPVGRGYPNPKQQPTLPKNN